VRRLLRHAPTTPLAAPPDFVSHAVNQLRRLLSGERVDTSAVPLDYETTPFKRHVYEFSRQIPPGQTRTYGELALAAGAEGAARAVGQAMATNPLPLLIPCHRVVAAGGRLCGFSAYGGLVTKKKLLEIESGVGNLFAA
jgi:methylated-DNA-[protein]-cysteine S-methyltransferase